MASSNAAIHCASLATMSVSILVFVFEGLTYNVIFLGRVLPAMDKSTLVLPFAVLFNSVWILAVWSYLRAHLVDPGSVPRRWQEFVKQVGDALPVAPARPEWQPGKATYCKKCEIPRPERAKHCKVCETCVLRMDHHCPWINNCVGFNNHKFFLLLGIYSGLACVVALGTSLPELALCAAVVMHMEEGKSLTWGNEDRSLEVADIVLFLVFGVLALLVAVLLAPLLSTHLPLAMQNITSIEDNYENMPNPFDQGGASANLAQLFGAFGPDWFFPITPWRPLTDGVSFERCDEPLNTAGVSHATDGQRSEEVNLSFTAEGVQPEQIWRQRFSVRSAPLVPLEEPDKGPLWMLTRWMNWP